MSNIDKHAQKELYAKVEQQAHSLRGSPREYQVLTGLCPVNVIEMQAQKIQALLDELEAKDAKIANLTAERDTLREGEMGDAKHSNTRAAADIYFQLVEECEIPAGGSLVEYVCQLRECAAAGKGE